MKSKFYLHFIEEYFKTKQRIMKKLKKNSCGFYFKLYLFKLSIYKLKNNKIKQIIQ